MNRSDSSLGQRMILIPVLRSTNDLQYRVREQSENVFESPIMLDFSKTSMIQSFFS